MRRTICALVATMAAMALGTSAAQAATGLVGHWRLDEGSGTTANDSSVFANPGVVSAGAQWIVGKRNGALHLDQGYGNVQVPQSSALEPAGAVTVEAWVRNSATPGNFKYVVAKGGSACNAASYGLYTGPDAGLMFYVSGSGGTEFTRSPDAGTGVWDGAWHLATGTFDGTTVRMYVDGVEVGSGTPRSAGIGYGLPDSNDLFIGRYPSCAAVDYGGDVDEVKVFNRALTPAEVLSEVNGGYTFTGFFAPVNNLPTLNTVKAGQAIPVKWSLSGDKGLNILAAGSPTSQKVSCSSSAPLDAIEQTVTAGSSSLSYDPTTDRYTYVWKSDKTWAGSCRQLTVTLDDGSVHSALFNFTR